MKITVVYSPAPRVVHEVVLDLPAGAHVRDALAAVQSLPDFVQIDWPSAKLGVWNHKANPERLLHNDDRVEIYRPLRVDPKVARRERFAKQGARSAGLFKLRRPGAKSGY
jgi:uncharacterized protein